MRFSFISAAVICGLAISTSAAAQTSQTATASLQVKPGALIRTADGAAIGRVQYVERAQDGALKDVGVIHDMRIVHIPADSLSASDKGYVTTLTKAQVAKLD
jgi:hypothetical protein